MPDRGGVNEIARMYAGTEPLGILRDLGDESDFAKPFDFAFEKIRRGAPPSRSHVGGDFREHHFVDHGLELFSNHGPQDLVTVRIRPFQAENDGATVQKRAHAWRA